MIRGYEWIHQDQGREQWRALVNMVMILRVSKWGREFLD
jgi:hypothetical protein